MSHVVITPLPLGALLPKGATEIVLTMDNLATLHAAAELIGSSERVTLVHPNINRFFKRTVFEVGRLLRKPQTFEIEMADNANLATDGMRSLLAEVFPGRFNRLSDAASPIAGPLGRRLIFACAGVPERAPFTGWSFGLLANGTSPEYVAEVIDSIVNTCRFADVENFELNIFISDGAEYEFGAASGLVNVIRTGWGHAPEISRKKNLICEASRFSEIAIMHDRFLLGATFCAEFARSDYKFGLAVPRITMPDGRRGLDWGVISSANYGWSRGGLLNYRDASPHAYCPGGFSVIRKETWLDFPWDNNLAWNQHEDVELSRRYQRAGHLIGCVPAPVISLKDRWLDQNALIPLDDQIEVLPGPPVSEMRVRFVGLE